MHGGLRYLEHLELALVHEVGRERETVHRNASHIVLPEKMLLPIIKGGSLGQFTTSLALYVYDHLAGVKKSEHRRMLSRKQTIEKEPLVESELLTGGAVYYEYKTTDSRLTIEVFKKASEYGALAVNYLAAESFVYNEKGKVCGVNARDLKNGAQFELKGKYVINATGAWVDDLRKLDNSLKGKRLHHTKGIHIVVSRKRFNLNHAIYFDVGDNRMVFAIPRFSIVYIGTTDTNYTGDFANPNIEKADVQYLLNAINRISPQAKLVMDDVESAWAGLRPLIHEEGKAPSELSRKDEIFKSGSGLLSIAGGKLTGYRVMAKSIIDLIAKHLKKKEDRKIKKCKTKKIALSGGDFSFKPETYKLIEYADRKYDEAKQTGISVEEFKTLFYRYGNNIDAITNRAFDIRNSEGQAHAWLKAELWYVVNHELASGLSDFFVRRTGMIHFQINEIEPILEIAAAEMAKLLSWTEAEKAAQLSDFRTELQASRTWE